MPRFLPRHRPADRRVIERTNNDFAPRKGKSPHAFCTDMTRDGDDVRVLANIVHNEYWMGTMLHEFGHSVYSSINIPAGAALRAALRIAHPDHRGRGHDVREDVEAPRLAGEDGGAGRRPQGLRRGGEQDDALPAADLLALVPGDAALREGHVRESGAGPEQAVVGPGGEVPGPEAAARTATPRTTPARSTSSAPRSTTTTT